ncbi:MAG: hypothetical protein COT81_05445 [Candidatus Buchananbacteria bacterium CG10_big_fil_rev_8_21_14_0_10_42_9]|uniref:YdbS-like PH domain-containing protein n=1 Tax=Candidatus Buchananbacteria bacterium CG10_big_fil_rev_8_21_14_0_10_42_9 TaxID=1974526 RepID=A0A2H0VZU9_9BACT|nr:MAG: hypothetical protein COT81_05445 [Candidatus Buchananbacteria bacterium CG10_big_fil_rev_8_21_14_0_10_42_9]
MLLRFFIPHQLPGEKIILLLRRHWFIILTKLILFALLALLPLLFFTFARDFYIKLFSLELVYPVFVLFASVYYLYIWLFMLHAFVDYYLDVWIVTNKRILNIEQKGLFARVTSEQKLHRVQDVTSELRGLFATILDYGSVYIQTAGEMQRFHFQQVPHPYQAAKKVSMLADQVRRFNELIKK